MAKTNYARNKVQDYLFGGVSFTPPASYFIGLSTTSISSSGSNCTEPTGAGYARVEVVNNKSNFGYSSSGCVLTSASFVFPTSSGSWGTIVDIALFDASTSGSIWEYTSLSVPKVVQTDTAISFSASALNFALS